MCIFKFIDVIIMKQKLVIQQMDSKLIGFQQLKTVEIPQDGWLHNIRLALKMTLQQLADRLGMTPQSIKDIELREGKRTVTLETLEKVGRAMNMKFIYGFIPEDGSIEKTINIKARELATRIVTRTSVSMKLENQEVSAERLEEEIADLTEEIKRTMPKYLWG